MALDFAGKKLHTSAEYAQAMAACYGTAKAAHRAIKGEPDQYEPVHENPRSEKSKENPKVIGYVHKVTRVRISPTGMNMLKDAIIQLGRLAFQEEAEAKKKASVARSQERPTEV